MRNKRYQTPIELGSFELTQPAMRVSDPCYNRDIWCSGVVSNCKTGAWGAAVIKKDDGEGGDLNAVIAVRHASSGVEFGEIADVASLLVSRNRMTPMWEDSGIDVGVDSGQAGFYDDATYQDETLLPPDVSREESEFGGPWYTYVCHNTLTRLGACVIPGGAVSSSGIGDGGYSCLVHRDESGAADAMFILFI